MKLGLTSRCSQSFLSAGWHTEAVRDPSDSVAAIELNAAPYPSCPGLADQSRPINELADNKRRHHAIRMPISGQAALELGGWETCEPRAPETLHLSAASIYHPIGRVIKT